jgi:hypothetical protein
MRSPVIHIQRDAGVGSPYDLKADLGAISTRLHLARLSV